MESTQRPTDKRSRAVRHKGDKEEQVTILMEMRLVEQGQGRRGGGTERGKQSSKGGQGRQAGRAKRAEAGTASPARQAIRPGQAEQASKQAGSRDRPGKRASFAFCCLFSYRAQPIQGQVLVKPKVVLRGARPPPAELIHRGHGPQGM